MTLALALTIAVLFGCGTSLLLKPDLLRVVAGIVLVSQSAVLALLAAGLTQGVAPVVPVPDGVSVSDPLPQAMALTALVIGLATTGVLLALVERASFLERLEQGDADGGEQPDADGSAAPEAAR